MGNEVYALAEGPGGDMYVAIHGENIGIPPSFLHLQPSVRTGEIPAWNPTGLQSRKGPSGTVLAVSTADWRPSTAAGFVGNVDDTSDQFPDLHRADLHSARDHRKQA